MVDISIRPMSSDDASDVARIFEQGIATKNATFETQAPSWSHFESSHVAGLSFVATNPSGGVIGWVGATPYSGRYVYRGVVEESLYLDESVRGQGIGRQLLTHFLHVADAAGVWTVQAGIFPENNVSVGLHHSLGFRTVGVRERLGQMDGVWRDVLLLERRID